MEEASEASVTIVSSERTTPAFVAVRYDPIKQVLTYLCVASSPVHDLSHPGPFFVEAFVFFRLGNMKKI